MRVHMYLHENLQPSKYKNKILAYQICISWKKYQFLRAFPTDFCFKKNLFLVLFLNSRIHFWFQVKCAHTLYFRTRVSTLSYADIAEVSFANGPKSLRKWSKFARFVHNSWFFLLWRSKIPSKIQSGRKMIMT